ncbi:MAG: hypothetical protein JSU63_10820 [Phycisphaerales bacterium]|nr:MAG: hypothetical protein JSU63_10820 [Phycisphaerales bacterium]
MKRHAKPFMDAGAKAYNGRAHGRRILGIMVAIRGTAVLAVLLVACCCC